MVSSPIERGLKGACPACGEGRAGDGPSVFVIFIVGIFIVPLMLAFQFATNAPTWLTLVIWVPIVILSCLGLLRLMRGIMFNLQFKHKAREITASDVQTKPDTFSDRT